jgi:NADH-quinone oxidoreductase subunit C
MTTDVDLPTAVSQQFPSAAPRPSLDCPAFDVPAADVLAVLHYLRDAQGYDFLMDVTAIDWSAEQSPRFTVVWHLYSSTKHAYVRVAAPCASDVPSRPCRAPPAYGLAPTGTSARPTTCSASSSPGIPDLRRILMWDAYPYHPLRKEFPLAGLRDRAVRTPTSTPRSASRVIPAPMAGGPFVATPGEPMSAAEPRAKDEAWNEKSEKPE